MTVNKLTLKWAIVTYMFDPDSSASVDCKHTTILLE